jgi:hypothetical protein
MKPLLRSLSLRRFVAIAITILASFALLAASLSCVRTHFQFNRKAW